jgi:cobalt-zinc-cadmium resistance protein CzcA
MELHLFTEIISKDISGLNFPSETEIWGTIADAQKKVAKIDLPDGYSVGWTGQFENQQRASNRLAQVVPVSIL